MKYNPLFLIFAVPAVIVGVYKLYSMTHHSPAAPLEPAEQAELAVGKYYSVGAQLKLQNEGEDEKYEATIYIKNVNAQPLVFKGYITSPSITATVASFTFNPSGKSCIGSKIELAQSGSTATVNLENADQSCEVVEQLQGNPSLTRLN